MAYKIKVMSIFGTRPETSKMAPVIKELEKRDCIESSILVTAQHREMLDQMLQVFDLVPDYDLNIMQEGQSLSSITTKALLGIEKVLDTYQPDIILVHGDTSTTFAAALAAFYRQIQVGHVEAGLRTYDKYQPYPEEMNRQLTTSLADIHFAPTATAKENLLKENVNPDSVFITGNTAVDSLKYTIKDRYTFENPVLNKVDFDNKRVIVMTAHRRENLGLPLENICLAAKEIVKKYEDVELIYPVHLNPVVQSTAYRILGNEERIFLTDPVSVLDLHNAMKRAYLVFTDSGGLQEEAPGIDKPVVVLRNKTERPEGLNANTLVLAGTDKEKILGIVDTLLTDKQLYQTMAMAKNPYGDGEAAKRIVDGIIYHFNKQERPIDFMM